MLYLLVFITFKKVAGCDCPLPSLLQSLLGSSLAPERTPSAHPECVLQWLLCEEKCVYSCPLLGVLGVCLNLALCDLRAA